MPDGDYGSDPTAGELADVARRGAREWQRDMAAWESDAELLRLRRRTLGRALWEAMQRGDHLTVTLGNHVFAGSLAAVRGDLAMLATGTVTLALNVGAIDLVRFERGGEGTSGDRTYGSLRAFAGMLEVEGPTVRFIGDHVDVRGRLIVVAEDHLLVEDVSGGRWAVAWDALAAIVVDDRA
jgi:hypothetical protein